MIKNEEEAGRSASIFHRAGPGWSSLHSWIFLLVVAIGLFVIGWQNRYYYLSPLGLGKAYRIDKLFGGIQEYDPAKGWILADIRPMMPPSSQPPSPMSMMEPPSMTPGSASVPMPGMMVPPSGIASVSRPQLPMVEKQEPPSSFAKEDVHEEPQPTVASSKPETLRELTEEERLEAFKKTFPDYGKDEFQLANDDLYPDWKKRVPRGTWSEFLTVYGDFVQWWGDQGSPAEAGFKLWNDFLTTKTKH
jgi:hypothetical protein